MLLGEWSHGASVYINKSKLRISMVKFPKKHSKGPWIKEHKIKNYYAFFKKKNGQEINITTKSS
jgi:hypothetical protein